MSKSRSSVIFRALFGLVSILVIAFVAKDRVGPKAEKPVDWTGPVPVSASASTFGTSSSIPVTVTSSQPTTATVTTVFVTSTVPTATTAYVSTTTAQSVPGSPQAEPCERSGLIALEPLTSPQDGVTAAICSPGDGTAKQGAVRVVIATASDRVLISDIRQPVTVTATGVTAIDSATGQSITVPIRAKDGKLERGVAVVGGNPELWSTGDWSYQFADVIRKAGPTKCTGSVITTILKDAKYLIRGNERTTGDIPPEAVPALPAAEAQQILAVTPAWIGVPPTGFGFCDPDDARSVSLTLRAVDIPGIGS
jgi:hypothetical protein